MVWNRVRASGLALAAAKAPESDQVFVFVKRFVEMLEGDHTRTPFSDLSLGAPSPVAH